MAINRASRASWLRPTLIGTLAFLAGANNGFGSAEIANILPLLPKGFGINPTLEGVIGSTAPTGGAIIGALFLATFLIRRLGMKPTFAVAGITFVTASILSALIPNVWWLVSMRFISGLAFGVLGGITNAYVCSLIPEGRFRDFVNSFFQFGIVAGIFSAYYIDAGFASLGWSWLLALAAGTGILLAIVAAFAPREGAVQQANNASQITLREIASSPQYFKALLVSISLHLVQQLTGINGVVNYANDILKKAGVPNPAHVVVGLGLVNVIATVVALIITLIVGVRARRFLLLSGLAMMGLTLGWLGMSIYLHNTASIALYAYSGYVAGFAVGPGIVIWGLAADVLPAAIRDRAAPFATTFNWGGNILVGTAFPTLLTLFGVPGSSAIFAGVSVAAFIFCAWAVKTPKEL